MRALKFTFYQKNMSTFHDFKMKKKTRRAFRFDLMTHDTGFTTEKPRRATGVEPAIPGIQTVCVSPPRYRGLAGGPLILRILASHCLSAQDLGTAMASLAEPFWPLV